MCPRGLKTGKRYENWDEVPNDTLLPDRYVERNGHPPPECPKHDDQKAGPYYLYEANDNKCQICEIKARKAQTGI